MPLKCSACGKAVHPSRHFCGNCGKAVAKRAGEEALVCTDCGAEVEDEANRFCTNCGSKFEE